ncbi:MAG: hypothetical protein NTX03_05175 [Bacteroidetes bacterium]|nr:hypothetical protein [Bacteroidota bacterium]
MAKQKEKRTYHFSDGYLIQRTDSLKDSLTNDIGVLATFGADAPAIAALTPLKVAFDAVGLDDTFMGQMMQKRDLRDADYNILYLEMTDILTKVERRWKENPSSMVREFGLAGSMSASNAIDLLQRAKSCSKALTAHLGDLGGFAITAPYITAFNAKKDALDASITNYDDAVTLRGNKTSERILAGNALYAEVMSLAKIGQGYWAPRNATKYEEYVINESAPVPVQNAAVSVNPTETGEITTLTGIGADTSMLWDALASVLPGGLAQIWWGNDIAETPPPPYHFDLPGGSPVQNHIAGDFGYDPVLNNRLFVRNNGTDIIAVHVRVNG